MGTRGRSPVVPGSPRPTLGTSRDLPEPLLHCVLGWSDTSHLSVLEETTLRGVRLRPLSSPVESSPPNTSRSPSPKEVVLDSSHGNARRLVFFPTPSSPVPPDGSGGERPLSSPLGWSFGTVESLHSIHVSRTSRSSLHTCSGRHTVSRHDTRVTRGCRPVSAPSSDDPCRHVPPEVRGHRVGVETGPSVQSLKKHTRPKGPRPEGPPVN